MCPHAAPFEDLGIVPDQYGSMVASLRYYPSEQLLYIHWQGNITADAVLRVATQELRIQKQLQIPLILNDKTESTGDWSDALSWLEFEWLPQAMENGLRAFAYVFLPDLQNQYISAGFIEKIGHQLPARLFYDVAAARHWLHHQPETA